MPDRRRRHHHRSGHRFRPVRCGDPARRGAPSAGSGRVAADKAHRQVQPRVTATNLPDLLVEWLQRIAVPPSAGQPVPDAPVPAGGRAHFHRQQHQERLQRRRAVGAVGLRVWPPTRSAGSRTSAGWRRRSRSSTTSANASRTASRSTSPTGSTGTSASSRAWSMSASTPSTRSSSWPMTNWRSGCRHCRRFRHYRRFISRSRRVRRRRSRPSRPRPRT